MSPELQLLESIESANYFIDKQYLDNLAQFESCALPDMHRKDRFLKFYQVKKIVYNSDENTNDKLISVYSSLAHFVDTLVLLVVGHKNDVDLYIGVRSKRDTLIASSLLHDAFMANFPGSLLESITEINEDGRTISTALGSSCLNETDLNVGCINITPSLRSNKGETFVQGLEKLIETMRGKEYTFQIIASPMSGKELDDRRKGYEEIYSALSPFANRSVSHGQNYGRNLTEGSSESISSSISNGISLATGTSSGYSKGTQSGTNLSLSLLFGFGLNKGTSETTSVGTNKTRTEQETKTTQTGIAIQKSESISSGTTDTITTQYCNKTITDLLAKLDSNITRLRDSASYGLWNCAAYIIAQDKKTVAIGSGAFKSLLQGETSHSEKEHFNLFGSEKVEVTNIVLDSLRFCLHPKFRIPVRQSDVQIVCSANAVSGREMVLYLPMPRKAVPGVEVSDLTEFGRNVRSISSATDRYISIGSIYHMDQIDQTNVDFSVDKLTSHCFITGSTGSGKSNTVYVLLEQLALRPKQIKEMLALYKQSGSYNKVASTMNIPEDDTSRLIQLAIKRPSLTEPIPFLVIEPTKGEYRREFGNVPGINVFCTNASHGQMLRINPFYFSPEIHILEHLDRLVEIFGACWEMYAAMPAILKDAMEKAYTNKGWDLLNSVYIRSGAPAYPTFRDLLIELPRVINLSGYSSDTKGDYIGALVTRVQSLTNGIYGQIFCDDFDIDDKTMFDHNTIIDLSRVGSTETKSLIMGMIVLRLTEYRMSGNIPMNSKLRHITVLEEAHNLLKNSNSIIGTAGSHVVAKSIEMISNSIAEMRTYGEGFIIVDQSPTSVDISAIKNTNTKIVMRLPEKQDCDAIGHAISLRDAQIAALSKLKVGVAVVMQNDWAEAVLTKIDSACHNYQAVIPTVKYEQLREFRSNVLAILLDEYALSDSNNVERIIHMVEQYDIANEFKVEMKRYILTLCKRMDTSFDSLVFGRSLQRIAKCTDAFRSSASVLVKEDSETASRHFYTLESVSNWQRDVNTLLDDYVELDEQHKRILIQYILYSLKFERCEINYHELYNEVFHIR